ncbi:MAG: replicative DNA helicase [Lachnospiraceae bacterium]|nr:replicative DNA helicase [Lachnospiraceae bacterium]
MDEVLIKRILPHSDEAEQAVIASMLMDKDAVVTAVDMLEKDDFYSSRYGILFEAMAQLSKEGKPADLVQVQDRVRQNGAPPEVSGMEFLREVLSSVPTSANIRHYAEIVKNKSILRRLIKTAQTIENECYESKDNIENILYNAEKNITGVTQSGSSEEIQPISEVVIEALDRMQAAANAGGKITGIATGFTDLDYKMAGLQNSDLVLVAARPSMGKTAFVLNIAQYVSVKHDTTTAIFSLEMSKLQLVNRIISMESKVDSKNIRTGNLSPAEWSNIAEGASNVGMSHIIIEDTPGISVAELRSKCRKFKRDNNLGLIIIDYIQLMSGGGKSESRQQEVSEISRALKGVARELNVPVIALSQLSRSVEARPDKRPMLSDLRESGAIEQDADVVMFIYREDYYKKDTDRPGVAEIIIAKQRNGPTGTVELGWIADLTKFVNLEQNNRRNEDF